MLKYLPWRYIVSRVARTQGLIDPVKLLSRMESLAQPMELKEPLELLRAGMVFHARGILNTGVIQHNLDWVWPFWVERQYDPEDVAFIPRAFSLTHINLTHRNWTAEGIPDCDHLPLVDPRGLVTSFWDGWSLDAWVIADDGRCLLPSQLDELEQELDFECGLEVVTRGSLEDLHLAHRVRVDIRNGVPSLHLHLAARLPAGFSAEHLGPNDDDWDDFWSIAGLDAAAHLLESYGDLRDAQRSRDQAGVLRQAVDRSLEGATAPLGRPAMPASSYRRLDAGAIGSLAAGYPLQLWSGDDPRLSDTADFLLSSCFVYGGFFQDMIHSGINPYLTLHVAQVLMRAGDPRALDLIDTVANLASPTGQWPEAVHPRTGGGCMGDGQHAWAAAEWVLALRNAFVREEGQGLVLGSGLAPAWWRTGRAASFGPTPTTFGPVTVRVQGTEEGVEVTWQGQWRGEPPPLSIRLPFLPRQSVAASTGRALVTSPGVLP